MQTETLKKYSVAVPRYTSYPTAPHFHDGIGEADYRNWIGELGSGNSISLYFHIPFCDTLCWFCGCQTKMTRTYEPVERYLEFLTLEIREVAKLVSHQNEISHVHWGGGSPTLLNPNDIEQFSHLIKSEFQFHHDAEFGVEIDPRGLDDARISALLQAGITRVSIGIQDFDTQVQAAINRVQTFEETVKVIVALREIGISSINIDLLYGLPFQTCDSIRQTIEKVLTFKPDRIALFGYAHVPWMKRHQCMIDETALPQVGDRFAQSNLAANLLVQAGYVRIGLDHFAKANDSLVTAQRNGTLRRNFQGYSTDNASAIIGLGASSIGKLPQGYIQNTVPTAEYQRRVAETGLAAARGYAFKTDDRLRAYVIERLMCDLEFSNEALTGRFGELALPITEEARLVVQFDQDGLVEEIEGGFKVTEKGRPFVRSICACFDPYLDKGGARYSIAI